MIGVNPLTCRECVEFPTVPIRFLNLMDYLIHLQIPEIL
jgi:hypothetical protein